MRSFIFHSLLVLIALSSTACRNNCGFWWGDNRDCGTIFLETDTLFGSTTQTDTESDTDVDTDSDSDTDLPTVSHSGLIAHSGVVYSHSGYVAEHSGLTPGHSGGLGDSGLPMDSAHTGAAVETDTDTDTDTDSDADTDTDVIVDTAHTGHTGIVVETDTDTDIVQETGGVGDTGLPIDTDVVIDDSAHTGHTGSVVIIDTDTDVPIEETAHTGEPIDTGLQCIAVSWYLDWDGDGATRFGQVTVACQSPGAGWSQTPPSDCNDGDATVHPGAVEIANDGIDQDCDGSDLITGPPPCAVGQSRLSGTYYAPLGATGILVSVERYEAGGIYAVDPMNPPLADGVDGWTVDTSVPGQVTFSSEDCHPEDDQYYLSAYSSAGSDCTGQANPGHATNGSWYADLSGVPAGITYVNNYQTPAGFPFGYGPGCEAEVNP